MKKVGLYFTMIASIAFLGGCELNDYPQFDDANAFVAFESEQLAVKENAGTLDVTVRLTSLKKISSTVTFEIIDSTAKQGVDFDLNGGASVLTFDGTNPVQSIQFTIKPHTGVFTGDRLFGIRITNPGSVDLGTTTTTWVTVNDLDHPLAFILGEFNATATSYFNGAQTWTVTLSKDPTDVTKVWITNLVVGGSSAKSPVFGVVNDEKTTLKIPVGQEIALSETYNVFLEGFYGPDGATDIPEGGFITGLIDPDGTIHIQDKFGSHVYYKSTSAAAGWYNIFAADAVFVKK
jgi:hypothetical protein